MGVQQAFASLKAIPVEVGSFEGEVQGHVTTLKGDLQGKVTEVRAQCDASVASIESQRAKGEAKLASIEAEAEARDADLRAQLEPKRAKSESSVQSIVDQLDALREARTAAIEAARSGLETTLIPLEEQAQEANAALDGADGVNQWIEETLGGKLVSLGALRTQVDERVVSVEKSLQDPIDEVLARMAKFRESSTPSRLGSTPPESAWSGSRCRARTP